MINLLQMESYKLWRERIFRVLLLLIGGLALAYAVEKMGNDITFSENQFFKGYGLSITIEIVMRFVVIVLAGFFVSSEYGTGTMKSLVAAGYGRKNIYLTKFIMFAVGAVIVSLAFPLLVTGFGVVFINTSVLPTVTYFFQAIGFVALYAVAFAAIMHFFAMIFTDSGKTIGFLVFFIGFFPELLELIASRLTFLQLFVDWSVFTLVVKIYDLGSLTDGEMTKLILAPIVTILVFVVAGSWLFQKKEVK